MGNKKGFITITNREIYSAIQEHNEKQDKIIDSIHRRLDIAEQKITFNNKLVIGAYGFTMAVLGFFISWVIK